MGCGVLCQSLSCFAADQAATRHRGGAGLSPLFGVHCFDGLQCFLDCVCWLLRAYVCLAQFVGPRHWCCGTPFLVTGYAAIADLC
jgi:hypothetical protein